MKASNFSQLSESNQTEIIWERGAYLDRRTEGFYAILLFQVDSFYTEVWYHAHFNVIIRIETFTGTDRLDPYLENIDLLALCND